MNVRIDLDIEKIPLQYRITDIHADAVAQKLLMQHDGDHDAAIERIRRSRKSKIAAVVNDAVYLGNRLQALNVVSHAVVKAHTFYSDAMNGNTCLASEPVRIAKSVLDETFADRDVGDLAQSPARMLRTDVIALIRDMQVERAIIAMRDAEPA